MTGVTSVLAVVLVIIIFDVVPPAMVEKPVSAPLSVPFPAKLLLVVAPSARPVNTKASSDVVVLPVEVNVNPAKEKDSPARRGFANVTSVDSYELILGAGAIFVLAIFIAALLAVSVFVNSTVAFVRAPGTVQVLPAG